MDTIFKDIRYGIRSLLKRPAFAAVAVITLALGMGANTAIFSIINALVINPPSIADPDRVVALWKTPLGKQEEHFVSYLDWQDWRTRNQSLEDIAAYKPNSFTLFENGEAEEIQGMRVTANFLSVLKIKPFRGRDFAVEEEKRGSQPVTIISYEYWQRKFGGNESVLNQQISLNGKAHTIIAILPPGFEFPLSPNEPLIWTTVTGEASNLSERGAQIFRAVGRLKPGVSIDSAQADMTRLAVNLAQEYPQSDRDQTIGLISAHEQIVGKDIRRALWLLLGAVGFILLIACTNMANLLLVRASTMQREIAIRSALGASGWRIARQLGVESLLLSIMSGGVGVMLAIWGLSAIKLYGAGQLPRIAEVRIDGRVLIFTLAVSVFTGVLFSLVPILKSSRPDLNEALRAGGRGSSSGRSLRLWRDSLVVIEVALSLILLVGAGLMIKSFAQLANVSPGFDPKNVLTGRISMTQKSYANHEQRVLFVNQTLERLKALPGVEHVAFAAPMPFSGGNVGSDFKFEGRPTPPVGSEPTAGNRSVTPDYFRAMKIPLLQGRYFNEQDRHDSLGAAIVNQSFVQAYFSGENPIGKRISKIGANQNEGDPEQWEIVGVVGDVHHSSLTKGSNPEIYLPYQQNSWNWGNLFIRTGADPGSLAESFRQQIRAGDKSVTISKVQPLSAAISQTIAKPRFYTFLFGVFGAIGLVLTMTGVYGLISYTVSQRTQEIGIRMALGANRLSVVGLVLRQGLGLALTGTVIGIALSLALTRMIVSLLFEIRPTDLPTFAGAVVVLLVAALLACYVPARRATKVDPLVALRYE